MVTASRRIVIATRNAKKGAELRALLATCGVEVIGLADLPDVPEVVEDGATFAENAAKKAVHVAVHLGCWTLGEDSGLEVDALQGAPGVYSARFSGPGATDDANNMRLVRELADVPEQQRGARYVCHIAVADPAGDVRLRVEETCRGRITGQPRGTNGFGYDPYFLIPELHRTFGELSPLVKRQISHRGRALRRLVSPLLSLI